jgi:uncharacterized cupredoxin-like copper-binding protein
MTQTHFLNGLKALSASSQWARRFFWLLMGLIFWLTLVSAPLAIAVPLAQAVNLAAQPVIEVKVEMGNTADELRFFPSELKFQVGRRYKLKLSDPSTLKHYFTAKDFADNIWSQKVEAANVEIKGAIHELELKPGAAADWVFVPIKPGTYELHCSVPGHAEAGMKGMLTIAA